MTWEDRTAAYDAGVRAGAAHVLDGAKLASPWHRQSRRTVYWQLGANRAIEALQAIAAARP